MTPPDDALTAAVRGQQHSRMNKTLAFLLGLLGTVAPVVAGYFAYRQAKVESATATRAARDEAAAGYRTLVDPLGLATTLLRAHESRIARRSARRP